MIFLVVVLVLVLVILIVIDPHSSLVDEVDGVDWVDEVEGSDDNRIISRSDTPGTLSRSRLSFSALGRNFKASNNARAQPGSSGGVSSRRTSAGRLSKW